MPIDPSIPLGVKSPEFQSPLEIYSTVAQLQGLREQTEARRLAAEEARQRGIEAREERAEKKQLAELYADAISIDPANGQITYNRETLLAKAPRHLVPTLLDQLQKDEVSMNTLIKSGFELDNARRLWLAGEAPDVIDAQGNPDVWKTTLLRARHTKAIDQATYDREVALTDPAQILARAQGWMARAAGKPGEGFTLNAGDVRFGPTGNVIARGDPKPPTPVSYQDTPMLLDGRLVRVGFNPTTNTFHYQGQDVTSRVKQPPPLLDPNLAGMRGIQLQLAQMQLEGGGLTPGQRASEINSLRNNWTKQIQPVLERRGAVAKIDTGVAALKSGNRNAATQIIITAFNKLQDETSVVREGEYARSEQGQALLARIQGAVARITQGGSNLTDTDLSGLATEAKNVATELEKVSVSALTDTRQAIEETLDDYKIPHSRVFGSSPIGQRTAPPPVDPLTVVAPNGKTYTFKTAAEAAAFKKRAGIQ